MQEAIIPYPAKAFGQDMLQDKPQEIVAFDGPVERLAGTAFDVLGGDLAIMIGDDVVFSDDAPVEIA